MVEEAAAAEAVEAVSKASVMKRKIRQHNYFSASYRHITINRH